MPVLHPIASFTPTHEPVLHGITSFAPTHEPVLHPITSFAPTQEKDGHQKMIFNSKTHLFTYSSIQNSSL